MPQMQKKKPKEQFCEMPSAQNDLVASSGGFLISIFFLFPPCGCQLGAGQELFLLLSWFFTLSPSGSEGRVVLRR